MPNSIGWFRYYAGYSVLFLSFGLGQKISAFRRTDPAALSGLQSRTDISKGKVADVTHMCIWAMLKR
ncbi:hypothetical protein SAMN05444358_1184 [Ruegeria halocynthiae]|uniref:Uncharacterized protein n=1 Tax=Ruegeria halocynthiae TaxID=985054 RepID=A0A1H3FSS2_9RHOB|nr:hypothetical protein SAMN05444358_1184 [Ruegeria halocynthiae]